MASSEEPYVVPSLELLRRLVTINILQTSSGFKGSKYAVLTEDELLFDMREAGHALTFLSKAHIRGFHINGMDNTGQHVFTIFWPNVSTSDSAELYMNDKLVSSVRCKRTLITPVFNINDCRDVPALRVKGAFAKNSFQLQTTNKTNIGSITREKTLSYTITFPADLDVRFKLAVICTCVFIDYRHRES